VTKAPTLLSYRRPSYGLSVLVLALVAVTLAYGLPPGYREDFNGCATNSPDQEHRDYCCTKTGDDCVKACPNQNPPEPACEAFCLWAVDDCKNGDEVKVGEGPDRPTHLTPGISIDGSRLKATEGVTFGRSGLRATFVEVRAKEEDPSRVACVNVAVTCSCQQAKRGGGPQPMCRPVVHAKAVECRICPAGASDEQCEPCATCRPVVLSTYRCVPGSSKAASEPDKAER
jgi:hypothetical protein